MLAFDAFIGAPDRHTMNWGVLESFDLGDVHFAPIFDTARGLFREHSDKHLLEKEQSQGKEKFLEKYANKSQPVVSTGHHEKQTNHFELIKWILRV